MKPNKKIGQLQKRYNEIDNASFKKSISKVVRLLKEIDNKDIPNEEKEKIQTSIRSYLKNIQTQKDLKLCSKKLKKALAKDFGFVPPNHHLALGIGLGLALGTSLGISIGVAFDNGIVFGPMIGSGIGLIGGLLAGRLLDKKKESEDRILKNL